MSYESVKRTEASVLKRIPNAPSIEVYRTPTEAGISISCPMPKGGVLQDGRIVVFSDANTGTIDVMRTVFHELFHRGLRSYFPSNADYIKFMLDLSRKYISVRVGALNWFEAGFELFVAQQLLINRQFAGNVRCPTTIREKLP